MPARNWIVVLLLSGAIGFWWYSSYASQKTALEIAKADAAKATAQLEAANARAEAAAARADAERTKRELEAARNSANTPKPLSEQPKSRTDRQTPTLPREWLTIKGSYKQTHQHDSFSIVASEAHHAGTYAAGATVDSCLAFWIKNLGEKEQRIKKLEYFAMINGSPLSGFKFQPPTGKDSITLSAGESHVLPLWFKKDAKIPTTLLIFVQRDQDEFMFEFSELKEMMEQEWDGRSWLQGKEFAGARIVHPRFYPEHNIDIGHGSEIFLGERRKQEVFFDLGPGKDWYEGRSLDKENATVYFVIVPYTENQLDTALTKLSWDGFK